jgi:hypothetical protein
LKELLIFGVGPAFVIGWATFRVLYVVDQHFGGLPKYLGDRLARPVLFTLPFVTAAAWLAYWALDLRA